MNNLNSVLLEGVLTACLLEYPNDSPIAVFSLESRRFVKDESGETNCIVLPVQAIATRSLALHLHDNIPIGSALRLVGRLVPLANGIGVHCEHIEQKSRIATPQPEEALT